MEKKLKKFLEEAKDWKMMKTTEPGVFIRKIPSTKNRPASLAIEINPPDKSGNPTKKTGVMVRNLHELKVFREILSKEILDEVMDTILKIAPHQEQEEEEVLEI
ncbi:MAG: hypothetical protein R6V83_13820 [Candidatus Thorarchaeota archaeon]